MGELVTRLKVFDRRMLASHPQLSPDVFRTLEKRLPNVRNTLPEWLNRAKSRLLQTKSFCRTNSGMAIEFNCPECSAAIRVPDMYSGKRGSCPKCSTKLIVPNVVPPQQAPESMAAEAPAPQQPAAPAVAPEISLPTPTLETDIPAFVATDSGPPSISRKLKRKTKRRKSQTLFTWGIPVVCLVLFFSVVAILMRLQTPELKGVLKGSVMQTGDIPTATVSWATFSLNDSEREAAKAAFDGNAEKLVSSQMSCRIYGTDSQLNVDFEIGEGYEWYVLNPATDVVLSDWIRENSDWLNARRVKQMKASGTKLCKEKIRKSAGEPVVFSADEFRDDFAINSHVKAFGSAVEAIGGDKRSFCFHEDSNGSLYFGLPQSITEFTLRGRTENGEPLFPGEYTVKLESLPQPSGDSNPEQPVPDNTEEFQDQPDSAMDPPSTENEPSPDDSPGMMMMEGNE